MRPERQMTPERIMQTAWAFAPPIVISAAVSRGIFDALDRATLTAEELAGKTGSSTRGARAIADALAAFELATRDSSGRYSLAPDAAAFLVRGKAAFHGAYFEHITSDLIPKWLALDEVVRTGRPAMTVNTQEGGAEFFEQFVESLFPLGYAPARALAEATVANISEPELPVLDLAAGSGVWGIALAQASPKVTVTAVDWERVLSATRRTAQRMGVADRMRYIPGDIAAADFGGGYAVATLGHILHSEGEERSRALLKKVFAALRPGGTIAIAEFVANDDRTGPPHAIAFAVMMLVATEHGDVFSFAQMGAWLREVGFENIRTLEAPGPSPLLLADKPRV